MNGNPHNPSSSSSSTSNPNSELLPTAASSGAASGMPSASGAAAAELVPSQAVLALWNEVALGLDKHSTGELRNCYFAGRFVVSC